MIFDEYDHDDSFDYARIISSKNVPNLDILGNGFMSSKYAKMRFVR